MAAKKKGLKLQPLGDRVVVQRDESEGTTSGGIVLPESAKDKPARGKVVSIGDGKLMDNGSRSELQVKVGDRRIGRKIEYYVGYRRSKLVGDESMASPALPTTGDSPRASGLVRVPAPTTFPWWGYAAIAIVSVFVVAVVVRRRSR